MGIEWSSHAEVLQKKRYNWLRRKTSKKPSNEAKVNSSKYRKKSEFRVGDKVFIRNYNKRRKFESRWLKDICKGSSRVNTRKQEFRIYIFSYTIKGRRHWRPRIEFYRGGANTRVYWYKRWSDTTTLNRRYFHQGQLYETNTLLVSVHSQSYNQPRYI